MVGWRQAEAMLTAQHTAVLLQETDAEGGTPVPQRSLLRSALRGGAGRPRPPGRTRAAQGAGSSARLAPAGQGGGHVGCQQRADSRSPFLRVNIRRTPSMSSPVEGHGEVSRAQEGQQRPHRSSKEAVSQIYLFLLNITPEHRSNSAHL